MILNSSGRGHRAAAASIYKGLGLVYRQVFAKLLPIQLSDSTSKILFLLSITRNTDHGGLQRV